MIYKYVSYILIWKPDLPSLYYKNFLGAENNNSQTFSQLYNTLFHILYSKITKNVFGSSASDRIYGYFSNRLLVSDHVVRLLMFIQSQ